MTERVAALEEAIVNRKLQCSEKKKRVQLWLALVAAGLLLVGLAGCDSTAEPVAVVTRVVTATATDAPTVQPSSTLRPTEAEPSKTPEASAAGSIAFVISDDRLWEKTAGNAYSISGEEDTFAWSRQPVRGDFEFSADVESDFANYRMTVRVAGDEASLYVDDRLVASTPLLPRFNREGYLALVKYGASAPVTFSNIVFKSEDTGEAIAAAPSRTPAVTVTPTNTPTPLPPPTNTLAPTAKPSPKPTSPPTATPPPPFRPPTGMLADHSPGGQGELLVKNGTDADALVILTGLDEKALKSAYIRNAESFNMTGIPDGTYRLYYSKGEAFNKETNRFTRNATYQRLDATVEFTTSATQYTTWEVTLYGVVGGNVGSEQVDPSQFP